MLVASALARPTEAEELAVIVHVDRQARFSVEELAQVYLKKRRFWNDGEPIVPVNRNAGSAAREWFVRKLFGEETRQQAVYWNRQYFRGVLPPVTLASDQAVKRFVASEPRAIGYVHPGAVDASVRVMLRLSDD